MEEASYFKPLMGICAHSCLYASAIKTHGTFQFPFCLIPLCIPSNHIADSGFILITAINGMIQHGSFAYQYVFRSFIEVHQSVDLHSSESDRNLFI